MPLADALGVGTWSARLPTLVLSLACSRPNDNIVWRGAASFCERCALLYNQLQRAARAQVRDSIWFAPPDWRMRQQRDSRCAIELRRLFEIGELELPAIWGSIRHYSSITLLAMCGCTTPYFISLFNSLSCTVNFSFSRRLIIFLLKSTASYSSVDSDIFFTHNNKAYI